MGRHHSPRIITDGLIICYDMANSKCYKDTNIFNLASNILSGDINNTPTWSNEYGGALYFNGTNQYINIPYFSTQLGSTILNRSTTIFTVKLPLYSGPQRCILSYRGNSLYIGKQNGVIFSYFNFFGAKASYLAGSVADNAVLVGAVTLNADTNERSHYVNGIHAGTQTDITGWTTPAISLNIGYDAGGTNEYMLGHFYNYFFYNRVLSSNEIKQNFNAIRGRFNL